LAQVFGRELTVPLVLHELVGELLPCFKPIHAGAADRGDVDERLLAAVIGLDKSIAFLVIVPGYCLAA